MTTEIIVSCNQLLQWTVQWKSTELAMFFSCDPDFSKVKEIKICLGCADFALQHIPEVAEGFPVIIYCYVEKGVILSCGAYPGMVYAFSEDILQKLWEEAGEKLDDDELYLSAGANEGNYLDPEHDDEPICADCALAGGGVRLEGDDRWSDDDERTLYKINPQKGEACWSCCQMIEENIRQEEENKKWKD